MFGRGCGFCAVLALVSCAYGDIYIDLRPDHPGVYVPGETVNVELWFVDKDDGHPITGEDILLRGYQFDFTLTDDTLKLPDQLNMETDPAHINRLFPDLPRPAMIYPLSSENALFQMTLPAGGEMLIGNLDVTVNDTGWLDVMNPQEDQGIGAWARFGFGLDDDDPVIAWRAFTGELTAGRLFMEVPEPASVVLLALGGLAVWRRRRPA